MVFTQWHVKGELYGVAREYDVSNPSECTPDGARAAVLNSVPELVITEDPKPIAGNQIAIARRLMDAVVTKADELAPKVAKAKAKFEAEANWDKPAK